MTIRTRTSLRWVVTGLMAALIVLSAVPDILHAAGAVEVFSHLGYPGYLLPFLGTAKVLGVAVVVAPGLRRLKEWAFAGLTFAVVGALYSHLSAGDPPHVGLPAMIAIALVAGAYAGIGRA